MIIFFIIDDFPLYIFVKNNFLTIVRLFIPGSIAVRRPRKRNKRAHIFGKRSRRYGGHVFPLSQTCERIWPMWKEKKIRAREGAALRLTQVVEGGTSSPLNVLFSIYPWVESSSLYKTLKGSSLPPAYSREAIYNRELNKSWHFFFFLLLRIYWKERTLRSERRKCTNENKSLMLKER